MNDLKLFEKWSDIALQKKSADVVFTNARLLNVFTEEIVTANVAVADGIIVGIGGYRGDNEIDCGGKILIPAFTDAHLHIESSMVRPFDFIECAIKSGTTTFVVDPHEVANVMGAEGIDFILKETEKLPANVYVMMPSCVPALASERNGCVFSAKDMEKFIDNPRILGLGEVMDIGAVLTREPSMMEKLKLFHKGHIDGHLINLFDSQLGVCVLAGISSDHECDNYPEAVQKRRYGIHVMVREGSTARNINHILPHFIRYNLSTDGMSFCTDDKHIEDIVREGHIDFNVRKAISLGMNPIKAIKMASLNPCRHYHLTKIGSIAIGRQADMLLVEDLDDIKVLDVFHKGRSVKEFDFDAMRPKEVDNRLRHTVNVGKWDKSKLKLFADETPQTAIVIQPHHIINDSESVVLPHEDSCFVPNSEYNKLTVIERHHATGQCGVCAIKGLSLKNCAIASTVGHDSHNIIAAGDNDEDIERAVNAVIASQGGYSISADGEVTTLPLEIMGLMTQYPYRDVVEKLTVMTEIAHKHGLPEGIEPFVTLSFLALPVIPKIRLTPDGLFRC